MLITDISQLTSKWLTQVLASCGYLPNGEVRSLEVHVVRKSLSYIVRLMADSGSNTAPSSLIVKFAEPGSGRSNRKEVRFYTHMASLTDTLPIITCFGGVAVQNEGFTLLLEDLKATHESHPPSVIPTPRHTAEAIIDSLADFHAAWWDDELLASKECIVSSQGVIADEVDYDFEWAATTLPAFFDYLNDRLSANRRQIFEKTLEHLPERLTERYRQGHLTIRHGDPHVGNYLYPREGADERVRLIDFKSWAVGLGADDLAHMMGIFWFPWRRAEIAETLLDRYLTRLETNGVVDYSYDDLWSDYRLSMARYIFYPMLPWYWNPAIESVWWHHLERIMLAYDEVDCAEYLGWS